MVHYFCTRELNMALIQSGFNRKSGLSGEEVVAANTNRQHTYLSPFKVQIRTYGGTYNYSLKKVCDLSSINS